MRTTTPRNVLLGVLAASVAWLGAATARAQGYPQDNYPPNYGQNPGDQPDEEIQQTVARISYIDGNDASYSRGDDPDAWEAAVVNVPLTLGDRVYTGDRTRMELQVHGGTFVRLAPQTDLTALNLTDDVKQLSLAAGTASFRLRRLRSDEVFEVDTPNVAVTFDTPGNFQVDVDENGNSRVVVRSGHATISADGGEIPVSSGDEISIQGFDNPSYDVAGLGPIDSWDRWVSFRDSRFRRVRSYQYVNADVVGVEDLDQYGRWEDVPNYGECWTPSSVAVGWTPYSEGQWIWQDPWGWTWVGTEPWGWAPYHYGRWVHASRWYWVPAGPRAAVAYSPALVAFVGGPGFSASFSVGGGGYVGWFPLAPSDPFHPWWGAHRGPEARVTNVTYVNRTYVTVVNQNTFVSGGSVARNTVRDTRVLQEVRSAPIVRGPLPVAPTTASLRIAAASNRPAPRPPAVVERRAVVTRVAPPPAPASFQAKERVIRENHGAPVAPRVAAQLSIQAHDGARAAVPVRPAASAEQGRIGLTPKRADTRVRPQAVTAPRGKALATSDRPLVANPTAVDSRRAEPPARIAPGAVVRPGAPRREAPAPRSGEAAAPPPPAPAPPPSGEAWRQRVPPGQERKNPPPEAQPPNRNEAQPPNRNEAPREARPVPTEKAPPPREVPPGRERQQERRPNAPPPGREAAPPPPQTESAPPPPAERRAPPARERQQEEAAPPPQRRTAPPPPEREAPPPPRREASPPEHRPAPPPAAEGKPAPRAQPPERGKSAKEKEKEKKKKEEPPPPPPSLR